MLPYGDMNQKCARGMVFPYNDGLIRSLPLRENHLKVMIDNIDERYKGIPVPVMTNEVGTLEDAVGTVIQWSRIAIVLSKVHLHYPLIFYLPYINFLKMREFPICSY